MKKNKYLIILGLIVMLNCFFIFVFQRPEIAGDGVTYRDSIQFLTTGQKTVDFSANRLVTTFGGLELIIFLSHLLGSISFTWIFINVVFYFLLNFFFYKIVLMVQKDEKTALISTLFVASSYGLITFGVNYLMDVGGWFFYVLSLYFVFKYTESKERKNLLLAALSVGIGVLFKEYAILGVLPTAILLIYENYNNIWVLIKKSFLPAVLAMGPLLFLYIYIYLKFDYTYLNWISTNKEVYGHINRLVQYIKCFGSLLNLLGVLFIFGLYEFWKERNNIEKRTFIFIIACVASFLPLFIWPGITQRVLFVSVPAIVLVSSFFVKKYIRYYYLFLIFYLLYMLVNFTMDSFILGFINLPI